MALMKKNIIICLIAIIACTQLQAQSLFTFGTHAVNKDEFLKAYNKNPDSTGT